MTNSLDERARRAAENLHSLVEGSLPRQLPSRSAQPARLRPNLAAFAGAFAAVLVLIGLFANQAGFFAPDHTVLTLPVAVRVTTTAQTTSTTTGTTTSVVATTNPAPPPVDDVPPTLVVTEPVEGFVSAAATIRFSGSSEAGATVWAGPYQADMTADGDWSIVLVLSLGENRTKFVAYDHAGNSAEATVSVIYQPPTVNEFSANFTWGECSTSPPYDEYFGTGQPGSKISVTSEYGSGLTEVNESGEWYLKVVFTEAPYGVTFPVTVGDDLGHTRVFEFTNLAG